MAKYVTILDIARELGISKSTVSRALSGDTGNVKADTLQRKSYPQPNAWGIIAMSWLCLVLPRPLFWERRVSYKSIN